MKIEEFAIKFEFGLVADGIRTWLIDAGCTRQGGILPQGQDFYGVPYEEMAAKQRGQIEVQANGRARILEALVLVKS